ncbi:MAG TPA: hypothetical protein VKC89_03055 [Patescibacteria group bacterium]|nr:hypothetical protein [Patescibacteria group bacterium]
MYEFGNLSPIRGIGGEMIAARMRFRSELERRLNGRVWKSPDIPIASDVLLQRGEVKDIPILAHPILFLPNIDSYLGPFLGLPRAVLSYARSSTRSRYEQVGVDVSHGAGQLIAESLQDDIDHPIAFVSVRNNSERSVSLPQGTRLFRLYIEPSGSDVEGQNLLEMIKKGEIAISGEQGKDWDVAFDRLTRITEDGMLQIPGVDIFGKVHGISGRLAYSGDEGAFGIWLRLDPDKRMWVPPDPDNLPIELPDNPGLDYRYIVDSYLKPAPVSEILIHWVGETVSKVKINPGVTGIIDRSPLRSKGNFTHGYQHANSLLLDGGSDWPIRTEILSPTVPESVPNYILLRFIKDKILIAK